MTSRSPERKGGCEQGGGHVGPGRYRTQRTGSGSRTVENGRGDVTGGTTGVHP